MKLLFCISSNPLSGLQIMPVVNLSFESMAFKLYNTEVNTFPKDDSSWCTLRLFWCYQ